MSNEKVILAFLNGKAAHTPTRDIQNGVYTYKGQTLKSNSLELINYSTQIAWKQAKNSSEIHLNTKKYSRTTTNIQNMIRKLSEQMGYKIIEYKGV